MYTTTHWNFNIEHVSLPEPSDNTCFVRLWTNAKIDSVAGNEWLLEQIKGKDGVFEIIDIDTVPGAVILELSPKVKSEDRVKTVVSIFISIIDERSKDFDEEHLALLAGDPNAFKRYDVIATGHEDNYAFEPNHNR